MKVATYDYTGDQLQSLLSSGSLILNLPFPVSTLLIKNNTSATFYVSKSGPPTAQDKDAIIDARYTQPIYGWDVPLIYLTSNGFPLGPEDSFSIQALDAELPFSPAGLLGSGPGGIQSNTRYLANKYDVYGFFSRDTFIADLVTFNESNLSYRGYSPGMLVAAGAGAAINYQVVNPVAGRERVVQLRSASSNGDITAIRALVPMTGQVRRYGVQYAQPYYGPPYRKTVLEAVVNPMDNAQVRYGLCFTNNPTDPIAQDCVGLLWDLGAFGTSNWHMVVTDAGTFRLMQDTGVLMVPTVPVRLRVDVYFGQTVAFYVNNILVGTYAFQSTDAIIDCQAELFVMTQAFPGTFRTLNVEWLTDRYE